MEADAVLAMQIVEGDPEAMPTPLDPALEAPGAEQLPDPEDGCPSARPTSLVRLSRNA